MITIQSGKMIIPENERFVGFAGDNLTRTKEFLVPNAADSDSAYILYLRFDDDRVSSAVLSKSTDGGDLILTWNVSAEHLLKSGVIFAQIKITDGENAVAHTGCDYFIAAPSVELADDGGELDMIRRTEFERRMNEAVAAAIATAPYIGDDGYWYVYSSEAGDYVRSWNSRVEIDSAISSASTNPVQNKAVKAYVDSVAESFPTALSAFANDSGYIPVYAGESAPPSTATTEYYPTPSLWVYHDDNLDVTRSWFVYSRSAVTIPGSLSQYIYRFTEITEPAYATPQMYGAVGDGETDDTDAIQAAVNAHQLVYFPAGTYMVDCSSNGSYTYDGETYTAYGIHVPSDRTLILDKNAVLKQIDSTDAYARMLHLHHGTSNVRITGGTLYGDRVHKIKTLTPAQLVNYHGNVYGIRLDRSKYVEIDNVHIENFGGDGISINANGANYSQNIRINRCVVDKCWRNGINIGQAKDVYVTGCAIDNSGEYHDDSGNTVKVNGWDDATQSDKSNITNREIIDSSGYLQGFLPQCGIDIEPNDTSALINERIYIDGCTFTGNVKNDIALANPCDYVHITDCVCKKQIQSSRIAGANHNLIMNSEVEKIILHGEKVVHSTIGDAVPITSGSVFDHCSIGEAIADVSVSSGQEIPVFEYNNCMIKSNRSVSGNGAKSVYRNCAFAFTSGSKTWFHGPAELNNCTVVFDKDFTASTTPILSGTFSAYNCSFTMEPSLNLAALINGSITLNTCSFDIPASVERILNTNVTTAVVINCSFTNRTGVGSFQDMTGKVIHGNVFKNDPDSGRGKSAYEIACDNGYSGTEAQWLASLKGADGTNGTNGTNGADGYSPTVTAQTTSNGISVTATDKNGTTSAAINYTTSTMVVTYSDNTTETLTIVTGIGVS